MLITLQSIFFFSIKRALKNLFSFSIFIFWYSTVIKSNNEFVLLKKFEYTPLFIINFSQRKVDFRAKTYCGIQFQGELQCLTIQNDLLFYLMHTDSVRAIYQLLKVEIYNYQKLSKTMSQTYQITLKINDMKRLKVGYLENDFYLVALRQDQIQATTKTQNILFSDSPFQIESDEPIDRIEVWNYKGRSRIGSLLIKGALKSKKYSHVFQKSNLLIQIAKVNTDHPEQVRARNIQTKKSMNSTLHSSSQEDF